MTSNHIIAQLEKNKKTFEALLSDLPEAMVRWRPASDKWSMLEIVCHLYDEEREDFGARVRRLLDEPGTPFTPIDPQGWVAARNYAAQDYHQRLNDFLTARSDSIKWLNQLQNPQWNNSYDHPNFGKMTAGMVLANWLAHDYLHIRQIIRYHFQFLDTNCGESLDYAGGW